LNYLKVLGIAFLSAFLFSIIFSVVSQLTFHLPYGWITDATGSMEPIINPGDIVFVLPLISNPQINDIVVYYQPSYGIYIAHQIIGLKDGGYITKGINNKYPDPWVVSRDQIKGFVPLIFNYPIKIPLLGYTVNYLSQNIGESTMIAVLIIGVIADRVYSTFFSVEVNRRKRRINEGYVIIAFLILSSLSLMVALSQGFVREKAYWFSSMDSSEENYKKVDLSLNIGTVKPNSTIRLHIPVSASLPSIYIFLTDSNQLVFDSKSFYVSGNSLINATLSTGNLGAHAPTVNILIIPAVIPKDIAFSLASINPVLLLAFVSIELGAFITFIVFLIWKLLKKLELNI